MTLELTLWPRLMTHKSPMWGVSLGPEVGPAISLFPFLPNNAEDIAVLLMHQFGNDIPESSLEA